MISSHNGKETRCSRDSEGIRDAMYECFEGPYDPSRRYIICIQGPTSTGKTTFARRLHGLLSRGGISAYALGLDSYYFKPLNPDLDEEDYDFDNPGALDWRNIFDVLKALRDREPFIEHNVYSASSYGEVSVVREPNTMPNVIIIDGVQAFNTINSKIFNIKEFDPYDTEKAISNEFVDNFLRMDDFKILKILMTNCASRILSVKLRRDELIGRRRDAIVKRFYSKTFPSTLRWIYSPVYSNFIKIIHGNFNHEKVELLMNELSLYFFGMKIVVDESKEMDLSSEFRVECTGECEYGGKACIVLDDKIAVPQWMGRS
ncbi:uridine kinase [Encephalitozoon romaleae SJ-2008]|uniref:Uridine kinase n=1 Tax=Encephalitozoon romaleae (strain SJ-2008) TaxID=1178016 RepID=I6ZS24_ENCRO|nr:uridine kinase [Encephalitozoon romaleae SJ-2008]AFN82396.1 uridine kinase [Encephalitozoon romaleae SJ-2008]